MSNPTTDRKPRLPATFDALREPGYRLFYAGLVISLIGTWMERGALAWYVFRITGDSELWLGLAAGVPVIPVLLVSIPAGALIDRVRVRTVLMWTQGLQCLGAAGIAALVLSGHAGRWHVLAYIAFAACVFAVDAPARHAFVVRLVGPRRITNAFALNAVAFQMAQVVGHAAFGLVMASTGLDEGGCLALNAASFLFVLGSLPFIRETVPPRETGSEHRRIADGLRHALRSPVIRAALLTTVTTAMFVVQLSTLLPAYTKKVWLEDVGTFAGLRITLGIGALIGGVTLASRSATIVRGALIRRYGFCVPPLLLAFAVVSTLGGGATLPLGLAILLVLGFTMIQVHSSCASLIQAHVPEGLRGRISSLFTLSVLASFPAGGLLAGVLAKFVGAPTTTIVAACVAATAYAAIQATHPGFREAA